MDRKGGEYSIVQAFRSAVERAAHWPADYAEAHADAGESMLSNALFKNALCVVGLGVGGHRESIGRSLDAEA
jgi:hypothetical protein